MSGGNVVAAFSVAGEPMSKARARFTGYGSSRVYTPERTLAAEARVRAAFLRVADRTHSKDPDAAFAVEAHFYAGTGQRRDVDNMLKLVLDGLNKVAWPDDVQVVEVIGRKSRVLPAEARTEIVVRHVGMVDRPRKACEQCGKEFAVYASTAATTRFCSAECRSTHRRSARERVCEQCDVLFLAHGPKAATRFCSAACKTAAGRVTVTCAGCGQEFERQRCHVRTTNYCTVECRAKHTAPRRYAGARGVCTDCDGPTSKKTYARCMPCSIRAGGRWADRVQEGPLP